jgi:hypothetical protein
MAKLYWFVFIGLCMIFTAPAFAQDTLPRFSVKNIGNDKFIIGWVNTYPVTKQISIQRSHDSLKNFTTILSVADPSAVQNGFVDTKAPNDHMFYRLFINLDKGQFIFTEAKKPVFDTSKVSNNSVIQKIKDISATGKNGIVTRPDFVPSYYVYTNKDGFVFINLPDAGTKKYHIKFFEDDGSFLFELRHVKESGLTLDKSNFIHSGWFQFELYNDEKLVEKNKFYLAKEF